MNDLSKIAVKVFRDKACTAVREIVFCSIRWGQWDDIEQALCIEAPVEFVAAYIWSHQDSLKLIARDCGFAGVLLIMLNERLYGPPIELAINKKGAFPMIVVNRQTSDGELAQQIYDSDVSCAVVDVETGFLRLSSSYIHSTSGRDEWWWEQNGCQLNSMWNPEKLEEVNTRLKQSGQWVDATYEAYSWEFQNGIWQRVPHTFHAQKLELTLFRGRVSRVSWGVEIVS